MKLLASSIFLLSGALAASASLQEEPPVACLESGACYQVLPFVRYLKVVWYTERGQTELSWIRVPSWWYKRVPGWTQVVEASLPPTRVSHMPNHQWEISGGNLICPANSGKSHMEIPYAQPPVGNLRWWWQILWGFTQGHKVHLKPADNDDANVTDIWCLIWQVCGPPASSSGRGAVWRFVRVSGDLPSGFPVCSLTDIDG